MDSTVLTLLLDIKEQNGAMGAQLIEAAHARTRMEDELRTLNAKVEKIEPVVQTVADMKVANKDVKDDVDELMGIKNRAAAIIVVATAVLTAAFALIFAGIKAFLPELKALFARLFS